MVPLIEGALDWRCPLDLAAPPTKSHFGRRAEGCGVNSVPGDLLRYLCQTALDQGRSDLIEHVFPLDSGSDLYRVILPEGLFFPVSRADRVTGLPVIVTLYTCDMARAARRERKDWRCKRRVRLHARRAPLPPLGVAE